MMRTRSCRESWLLTPYGLSASAGDRTPDNAVRRNRPPQNLARQEIHNPTSETGSEAQQAQQLASRSSW